MSSVVNTILHIDDEMMLLYNNTNECYGTSAAHIYEVPNYVIDWFPAH